ncbi:MAG: HAMP domain-containing histidine kinase [Betaproteobacteria bacterium]|nr:HAMP domain-containing histidine kinase [Betaproteobacteria bacterium]
MVWQEREQVLFFRQVQDNQRTFVGKMQDEFARRQGEVSRRDLLSVHESGNINLTRLFANALWERDFAPFVARAQAISAEHCQALPEVTDVNGRAAPLKEKMACFAKVGAKIMALAGFNALNAKVFDSMKKSTVFKIKVYDLRGITVYSSDHKQIGEDKSGNAGWRSATEGKTASLISHRTQFGAFEGVVSDRDLIESYIPLMAPGTDTVVGVFEVYSDVTPFLARIKGTSDQIRAAAARSQDRLEEIAARYQQETESMSNTGLLVLIGLLALLFGALFMIVRHAERLLRAQEDEREHGRQQLAQSEKMASLGQMVAGVTHQLNTPLAFSHSNVSLVLQQLEGIEQPLQVASQFAEFVRRTPGDRVVLNLARSRSRVESCEARPEDVGQMCEMLRDVLHGIDQMSELVTHMRNFTRLDRARTSDFDINKGLATVVYIARSVIPGRVRVVEAYADVPPIHCNGSQLNQVFLNLITNAAQSIEGAGTVTIRSSVEHGRVRVDVTDTGSGIAPDVLPQIFDNYFTTKNECEGTGLGLAIARDIVRNHGGNIEVDTGVGQGTTFTVWLPITGTQALPLAA